MITITARANNEKTSFRISSTTPTKRINKDWRVFFLHLWHSKCPRKCFHVLMELSNRFAITTNRCQMSEMISEAKQFGLRARHKGLRQHCEASRRSIIIVSVMTWTNGSSQGQFGPIWMSDFFLFSLLDVVDRAHSFMHDQRKFVAHHPNLDDGFFLHFPCPSNMAVIKSRKQKRLTASKANKSKARFFFSFGKTLSFLRNGANHELAFKIRMRAHCDNFI